MDELLTVIVQTSPIPSHPSTALLEALFRSFLKADGLLESRIVIVCDGCETVGTGEAENHKHGKASMDTAQRYREHLQLLQDAVTSQMPPFVPHGNGSIQVLQLQERHGSARAIQAVFPQVVTTPLVMIAQHDNFFVQSVPLRACAQAMHQRPGLSLGVKCLHWMSTATLDYANKVQQRYNLDVSTYSVDQSLQIVEELGDSQQDQQQHQQQEMRDNKGQQANVATPVPPTLSHYQLVPLVFWYGRTHLSYTDHYREVILKTNTGDPFKTGDHLEELLGVEQLHDIQTRGMAMAHQDYGTFVLDQGIGQVIYHLSGRRARAVAHYDAKDGKVTGKEQSESNNTLENEQQQQHSSTTSCQPGSFTTAKSCRAIVPGLEIMSTSSETVQQKNQSSSPAGRFKQKCFHCGLKGHSYKWCPNMKEAPVTETIDLS